MSSFMVKDKKILMGRATITAFAISAAQQKN